MAELALRTAVIGSAALLAGCGQAEVANEGAAAANAAAPAPVSPQQKAEALVRRRLPGAELRFGDSRTYRNRDVPVVCGTFSEPGRPHRRYLAVTDIEVWIEEDMPPGEMDRAFAEFCKDGAANA